MFHRLFVLNALRGEPAHSDERLAILAAWKQSEDAELGQLYDADASTIAPASGDAGTALESGMNMLPAAIETLGWLIDRDRSDDAGALLEQAIVTLTPLPASPALARAQELSRRTATRVAS